MSALRRPVTMMVVALFGTGHALAGEGTKPSSPPAAQKEITLGAIRAHLFYEPLGKMDARDLVSGEVGLWNTIIGEGEAEAPSNTTVVIVDVLGPSFPAGTKGTLSMTARDEKHLLRRETVKLETFFSQGPKLSIPFVVVGTGCGTLKIDVELAVKGKKTRLARTVEYPCGE